MGTILLDKPNSRQQLREAGEELYGDMVKAVVDVKKGIMAAGGELHADDEAFLLERGSVNRKTCGESTCTPTGNSLRWWRLIQ
jgi:Protein of unknown function (DUF5674)